jgi:4a-hydroxytetrahydrobiopterin dehydratase
MSWKIVNNRLTKEFSFKNQTELATFFLKVAELSDKNDHHPDVQIRKCSILTLELYTHTENKISELDYSLAKIIDEIVNVSPKN